eukprot:844747-Prorocentrum_minimum.AAC.1
MPLVFFTINRVLRRAWRLNLINKSPPAPLWTPLKVALVKHALSAKKLMLPADWEGVENKSVKFKVTIMLSCYIVVSQTCFQVLDITMWSVIRDYPASFGD